MNFKIAKLKEKLLEKLNETLKAVLPIIAIVLVLCFTIAPLEPGILLAFLLGAVFLIVGMMFFYSGRGDVYDTYRRKCGNKYDADEKTVADGVSDIYPRFYRDHIGAGSSGAGRAGARGAEYGSCAVCGVRAWESSLWHHCSACCTIFRWRIC